MNQPTIIVLMGVCGSGKTTIGLELSKRLGWPFFEGDGFHPIANKEKMRSGTPLTDDDRRPWLKTIRVRIEQQIIAGHNSIFTCSALKEEYRKILSNGIPEVRFIHLSAPKEVIAQHIAGRTHAFMPASLLDSQFATLEAPADALEVDVSGDLEASVQSICRGLQLE